VIVAQKAFFYCNSNMCFVAALSGFICVVNCLLAKACLFISNNFVVVVMKHNSGAIAETVYQQ